MIRSLLVAIAFLGAALQASAQDVTCGMTIRESITLTQDLTCFGTAFLVDPLDLITIDLGGYTVLSDCSAYGHNDCATIQGNVYAVIQNGRVAVVELSGEYAEAIVNWGGMAILQDLVVDGGAVVSIPNGQQYVRNSTFINGASVYCGDSNADLENNDFVEGPVDGRGIDGFLCSARIVNNTFSGYGSAVDLSSIYAGGAIVEDNFVEGGGISIASRGFPGAGSSVSRNYVTSAPGHGISVDDGDPPLGQVDIRDNTLVDNSGDGISVLAGSDDVTVSGNLAVGNTDLGIEAIGAGVVDGGGNRATGNGNPLQCLGVTCTPPPPPTCGLGGELAFLLPLLFRRRRHARRVQ